MKKLISTLFIFFLISCSSSHVNTSSTHIPNQQTHTPTGTPSKISAPTSTPSATSMPASPYLDFGDIEPGQYILYQTDKADKVSLSALSPYTGETYSLYNANYPSRFELSPGLNRLALVKEEQLELIDLKTGSTKTINFGYVCSDAAWSPDESKLALTCGDVFIVNFSDLSTVQITDLSATHLSNFGEVSWSPDGKSLAYNNIADPYGDDPYDGVYITDTTCLSTPAKCKEQTRFFPGLLYQFVSSTWSPDSSKLAFLALASIFVLDIAPMEIDSSIELPYINISDFTGLAWSSDETQFAISNEIEKEIIIISSKDGKEIAGFPVAGIVLSWIYVP